MMHTYDHTRTCTESVFQAKFTRKNHHQQSAAPPLNHNSSSSNHHRQAEAAQQPRHYLTIFDVSNNEILFFFFRSRCSCICVCISTFFLLCFFKFFSLVFFLLAEAPQALNEPHGPTFNARMNRQRRQRQQHGDKPVLYKPAA